MISRRLQRLLVPQEQRINYDSFGDATRIMMMKRRFNKSFTSSSSSSTTTSTFRPAKGHRLRVAVVGGGASGLSTALHLAPLVQQGHICGPIDVFEGNGVGTSGGAGRAREIGVGIWSTALDPFRDNVHIESHQLAYHDMVKKGTFIRDVGYRIPRGDWLAKSRLEGDDLPDLLFLREMDMLASLRKAVHLEEHRGNVILHSKQQVASIYESSNQPWSAPLVLQSGDKDISNGNYDKGILTDRDYHLIVAADGMNSVIRRLYGGYISKRGTIAGAAPMPSPLDLPQERKSRSNNWYVTGQAEATSTQDRQYTVFRGNAPISSMDVGIDKSFQTWGEGRSMRFATVPMFYPSQGKREERQVWFITINDDQITKELDPVKRRDLLLEAFKNWHYPICQLVEATPPNEILMERAMAHKHSMSPVANFNGVVRQIRRNGRGSNGGNGPAIVFVGDAFMTIDPILAQGFTIGLEGAAALSITLENILTKPHKESSSVEGLAFDPYMLRHELKSRHDARLSRLIHLLRATELVQALGQPTTGTFTGLISRDIIRPLMRWTPDFIKTPIFNAMLKYSLGLPLGHYNKNKK